jgi:alkylation response protein AidB-like acyl-CoA dehydrogenase
MQDDDGGWYLNGVKRFITNGCGEVLLTLARSEPDISDGRGLSLFVSERNERVKVRHLENKLGIHGSPTCELVFDDCPAELIGERQRGLITYVMALMNGARVGIAAQSLGIAEAAYRLARDLRPHAQQFGGPIERLPAVAEMVTDMKIHRGGPGADLRDVPHVRPGEQQPADLEFLPPRQGREEASASSSQTPQDGSTAC